MARKEEHEVISSAFMPRDSSVGTWDDWAGPLSTWGRCIIPSSRLDTMSAPFTATPAELGLVNQIFARADQQKLGILNGEVAVQVFSGAKLPGSVLGEIWNIADEENNGWLSKKGAAKAVRLIAHAQNGEKVSTALLTKR